MTIDNDHDDPGPKQGAAQDDCAARWPSLRRNTTRTAQSKRLPPNHLDRQRQACPYLNAASTRSWQRDKPSRRNRTKARKMSESQPRSPSRAKRGDPDAPELSGGTDGLPRRRLAMRLDRRWVRIHEAVRISGSTTPLGGFARGERSGFGGRPTLTDASFSVCPRRTDLSCRT